MSGARHKVNQLEFVGSLADAQLTAARWLRFDVKFAQICPSLP
jgi:hypothetical protein